MFPYCCLLIIASIISCSVFKVHLSCSLNEILLSKNFSQQTADAQCAPLQGLPNSLKVFFAHFLFQKKVSGGPKWTRTTDLTIISRVL